MLANPKLNTTLVAPLLQLEKHFLERCKVIDEWFANQFKLTTPPVYGSVDLRNAGFKLAPVDMNLFPAGFNNLNSDFMPLSIEAARSIIEEKAPQAKSILLIPENHTRNIHYWENIKSLFEIL